MKLSTKKVAITLCIIFICLFLLSTGLIVVNHGHDCIGKNCNVCCFIETARKILSGLTLLAVATSFFAAAVNSGIKHFLFVLKKYFQSSLISLKVKLSD